MNIVLFLGAGFSRAFHYPTMDEFLSSVDSSEKLDPEEKNFVGRLVLEARRANSFLQSSPTNLEDILSFSVMADRLSLNRDKADSDNLKIKLILQKIFTQVQDVNHFWSDFETFKSFLTFNPGNTQGHNLSIVTTNYDLCIECALVKLQLRTDPGFEFVREHNTGPLVGNLYKKGGIPVYKLHGSVNWFEIENNPNSFSVEDRVIPTLRGDIRNQTEDSLPFISSRQYVYSAAPVIVPPSFLKPDLQGPLNAIWKGAAGILQTANILIFIGYSFPLTDTDMMYFLARSLTDNPGLRKILIIDPIANAILDKLNSPQSKFGTHFRSLIQPENHIWQQTTLEKYL